MITKEDYDYAKRFGKGHCAACQHTIDTYEKENAMLTENSQEIIRKSAIEAVNNYLISLLSQDKFCEARRVGQVLETLVNTEEQPRITVVYDPVHPTAMNQIPGKGPRSL